MSNCPADSVKPAKHAVNIMKGGLRIANLFKLSNEGMWKRYNFADLERDEYPQVWDAAAACSERDHVVRRRGVLECMQIHLALRKHGPCLRPRASVRPPDHLALQKPPRRRPGERGRVRGASDS